MKSIKTPFVLALAAMLAVAVVGVGCKEKTTGEKMQDAAGDAKDAVKDAATDTKDAVKDAAKKTGEAVKEGAEATKDAVTNAVDSVTSTNK